MSSEIYKCPNCGANLTFDASSANISCEYCRSEFSIAEVESFAEEEEQEEKQFQADTHGYHCDNCGAEVVTDAETSSGFCYYCHSPVIFSDKLSGQFVPDYVIPFKISKEKAQQTFKGWVKKFKLVPRGFASSEHLEKMTGIYVPYWLVDVHAKVDIHGSGEVVTTRRSGDRQYTTYKQYSFRREGDIDINHIKTIASDKVDQALVNSVESNTLDKLVPFSTAYLSGYFSQRYTLSRADVKQTKDMKINAYIDDLVRREINYENIKFNRNVRDYKIKKWSYILLPMWILTYQFEDKTYVYALNGENGESFGELPISYASLIKRNLIILAGVAATLLLGGAFIW